jgi:hypothetical protein
MRREIRQPMKQETGEEGEEEAIQAGSSRSDSSHVIDSSMDLEVLSL